MSKKQRKKSVKNRRKKSYTVQPGISNDSQPLLTRTPQAKKTRKTNGN